MNIFIRSSALVLATAAASAIAASSSFADDSAYMRLADPVRNQLLSAGATENGLSTLTRAQIGELSAVFDTSDGAGEQEAAARAIIERSARNARLSRPAGDSAGAASLVAEVDQSLRAAGIRNVDPAMLSLNTVQRLSQVFSDNDGNEHAAAARAILEEAPRHAQLARTVAEVPAAGERARLAVSKLRGFGVRVADPEALTLGQLSQISSLYDKHDGDSERAAAISRILAR